MAQVTMLGHSTPVHSLPVELLLEAFAYVAHSSSNRPALPSAGAVPRACQWTQLMLVCQRWRAIITGAPQFWTSIDLVSNSKWVELCLDRSGQSSVDVRLVGLSSVSLRTAIPLVVAAGSRIRSLTFQSYMKTISSTMLQRLFSSPMPALEGLSISLDWREHGSSRVDLRLSARNHPRLRSLSLTGVPLPIEPSVYSRMKSLSLHQGSTPPDGVSFPHLARILREAAPQLQDIDLSHIHIPPPPASGSHELDRLQSSLIHFPRLRSLYMDHDNITASRVLGILDIPACTFFHLRVGITSLVNGSFRGTLLGLVPQNIRPILDNATELAISMTDHTYSIRDPGSPGLHAEEPGELHLHRVYIFVSDVPASQANLDDIAHVATLLHLTTLTVLSEGRPISGASAWGVLLSACPNLRTLDVSELPPTSLFLALTPWSATAPTLCPALCTLSVTLRGYTDDWGKHLLSCLQARSGPARRLSSLSLKELPVHSLVGSQRIRELRSLVDDLNVS
ncbi:hypothetical protein TRAPUB_891 [Trametes pubescens]|uniref:F-box domain-containing protein n=1 Tax=Trametes pubescens TaxID=154538 RepID=A0A1M2VKU5_TRAPU|nr:hypothetical protein TRAPUB_891 [Trametes pubescens]